MRLLINISVVSCRCVSTAAVNERTIMSDLTMDMALEIMSFQGCDGVSTQ
jgi:hypothetical protein